jgi:hypothetical protein
MANVGAILEPTITNSCIEDAYPYNPLRPSPAVEFISATQKYFGTSKNFQHVVFG